MSKLMYCRTCGEKIYYLNATNLFDQKGNEVLKNIQILTGISLNEDEDMPKHICACCQLDLNHAISFRERCLETHKLYLNGKKSDSTTSDPLHTEEVIDSPLMNEVKEQPALQIVRDIPQTYRVLSEQKPKQNRIVAWTVPKKICHVDETALRTDNPSPNQRVRVQKVISLTNVAKTPTSRSAEKDKEEEDFTYDEHDRYLDKLEKKVERNRNLVCDQCGRCFSDYSNLKVHMVRHTGVKAYECKECDAKYYTQHLLNIHIRVSHKGEKPYACKFCGERYFTSTARCRHEQVKHKRNLKYTCRLCGKAFMTRNCLKKHEFLHTGQRPYRCDVCDVGFPRNTNLKIHYRSKQHQRRFDLLEKQCVDDLIEVDETEFEEFVAEDFDV